MKEKLITPKKIFLLLVALIICRSGLTQINFPDLVKQTEKAVVSITTLDHLGNKVMIGTGFFIQERGMVLSNYHIFKDATDAVITTSDKTEFHLDSILVSSKEYDIIKFSISNPDIIKFSFLKFIQQIPLKGEDIFTIGNPLGLESTVSKGIISSIREIPELGCLFQITAPISAGSSGSPVLNMRGEVVGIASYQMNGGQNLNFAIDVRLSNKIKTNDAILDQINAHKKLPTDKNLALRIIDSLRISDEKLGYINEFIKKYPNDYHGFYERARLFSKTAYDVYQFMEPQYKNAGDSLFRLGEFKVYAKANNDYITALKLNPTEPLIYYNRGLAKYNYCKSNPNKIDGWDIQGALADLLFCSNLKDKRDQQNRFYSISLCYRDLKNYNNALTALNNALNIKDVPTDTLQNACDIYYDRGVLKVDQFKDTIGGLSDINKAIELSKSIYWFQGEDAAPSKFFAKRALIRNKQRKYEEALADLKKVNRSIYLSEDGRRSYTHYLESFIILKLEGDLSEALSAINQAIKFDDYINSYYKTRARVFSELKDYSSALKDFNKAFELDPKDIDAWDYSERSRIKGLLNDNLGAIKDIDAAIKYDGKDDYFYNLKAIFLSRLGDNIGAEKQYDKAIELNPKNAGYYISRGWTKLNTNKNGACADWSKAGELGKYEAYDLIQKYCK